MQVFLLMMFVSVDIHLMPFISVHRVIRPPVLLAELIQSSSVAQLIDEQRR